MYEPKKVPLAEAAAYLGVTVRTFRRWTRHPEKAPWWMPPHERVSHRLTLFSEFELQLAAQRRERGQPLQPEDYR